MFAVPLGNDDNVTAYDLQQDIQSTYSEDSYQKRSEILNILKNIITMCIKCFVSDKKACMTSTTKLINWSLKANI